MIAKDNIEQILKGYGFLKSDPIDGGTYEIYESITHKIEYFTGDPDQFTLYRNDIDMLTAHVPDNEYQFKLILEIYLSV